MVKQVGMLDAWTASNEGVESPGYKTHSEFINPDREEYRTYQIPSR